MTKEYLLSLGLTEEQADAVLAQFKTETEGLGNTEQLTNRVQDLETQLAERDTQLEELGSFEGTVDELKEKITELEQENEGQKAQLEGQKLEHTVEKYLSSVGAKSTDVVRKMIDIEKVTLNEDGSLGGIEEQVTALKKDHPYLFDNEDDKKDEPKLKITTGNHSASGDGDSFSKGLLGN